MTRPLGFARLLDISAQEAATLEPGVLEQEQVDEMALYEDGLAMDKLEERYADAPDDDGDMQPLVDPPTSKKRRKVKEGVVQKASEGIIQPATRQEYERQWRCFVDFLQEHEYVDEGGVDGLLGHIPSEFPEWICSWIMSRADPIDVYTGEQCHPEATRVTYTVAQKMRAAVTHKFGREYGLGPAPWAEDPMNPGAFTGNPSVSATVSQYMISLRRRKVRGGEVVTSARAMNEDVMKQLYEFNKQVPREPLAPNTKKRKTEEGCHWAGYQVRMMLHLLYTISMLCLLRYDEALNIRWEDITIGIDAGVYFIRLDLPFRKTHQQGHIMPFYLYLTPDKPHMCAVLALARWWRLAGEMGIQRFGYIFRKRFGYDRVAFDASAKMSSDSFLVCLRNNLCDIKVDPRMYGTHSFRRGGCQYLHVVQRLPIREICKWGGWTESFDSPGTIFKYLLSWTDVPLIERSDYLNPNRKGTNPCSRCNRTCNCA